MILTMKRLSCIFFLLLSLLSSCSHDDIWEELQKHEDRIARLEMLCAEMNTNISALQTIVNALESNDFVSSITPVKTDGVVIGYTISFTQSGDVTIYHGADGSDGADGEDGTDGTDGVTPEIGVRADEDGVYYWTLGGEWLLDDAGNRIKASSRDGADGSDGSDGADGTDGENGITPRLKISNDYWYVSYDGGETWVVLGKAKGEDGNVVFSGITVNDDSVVLVLADGTTQITLPRKPETFDISFEDGNHILCGAGEEVEIPYSLTYGSNDVQIKLFPDSDLDYMLEKTDSVSGKVRVKAPDPFMEDVELTLLISDGDEKTIMRTLCLSLRYDESYVIRYESNTGEKVDVDLPAMLSNTCSDGVGEIVFGTPVRTVTGFAGRIDLKSITLPATATAIGNAAFKGCTGLYDFVVPDGVSVIDDYAFSGCDRLVKMTFGSGLVKIGSNAFEGCTGFTSFEVPDHVSSIGAYVFKDCSEDLSLTISYALLMQNSYNKTGNIVLKGNPSEIVSNAFADCTGLKSVTLPESVTSIGAFAFYGCSSLKNIVLGQNIGQIGMAAFSGTAITSFVMPSKVTVLSAETFKGCRSLASVDFGSSLLSIGDSAFEDCMKLESVIVPDSVRSIGDRAFIGTWMDEVSFGSSLETVGAYAFAGLFFRQITLPDSLVELKEGAFASCAHLASIDVGERLQTVGDRAFYYNDSLTSLVLPATMTSIGQDVFTGCSRFVSLYCEAMTPPAMNSILSETIQIYVPSASLSDYKTAPGWSDHAEQISGI